MIALPRLESFQDVVSAILPICPTMTETDIANLLVTIHDDPSSGPDILAAYQAAENAPTEASTWQYIWNILTTAAAVGSVITSIAGAVALV